MGKNVRLGDRREYLRFDVSGQLWGSFERAEHVLLKNISNAGALIEATLPTALKSIRAAQVLLRDGAVQLNAVVRHLSPVPDATRPDRVLVGLEFVHVSASAQDELDRIVREWREHADGRP
jgi:hypothetical protein